jgi:hypothetical protein
MDPPEQASLKFYDVELQRTDESNVRACRSGRTAILFCTNIWGTAIVLT